VVEKVYQKIKRPRLLRLDLDEVPVIYPVVVPLYLDLRAAADRSNNPKVSALAKEITSSKNNAFVIADGVDKKVGDQVLTFQSEEMVFRIRIFTSSYKTYIQNSSQN